jgi:phosphatidylserine/phosphatidylglycerophosphate/cardiolipin synthase-like enzyme
LDRGDKAFSQRRRRWEENQQKSGVQKNQEPKNIDQPALRSVITCSVRSLIKKRAESQRTERYSSATFLIHAGIATFIDARHAIAHNKVMVIDGQTVLTGSFNFTKAAEERNAENLLVLRGRELASKYTANWREHRQHSEPYTGPAVKTSEPRP